jgi:hypothetical protein
MATRIEWQEKRGEGLEVENFFVVAERIGRHWQFYERSSFEWLWYPLVATPERMSLAEKRSQTPHCQRQ